MASSALAVGFEIMNSRSNGTWYLLVSSEMGKLVKYNNSGFAEEQKLRIESSGEMLENGFVAGRYDLGSKSRMAHSRRRYFVGMLYKSISWLRERFIDAELSPS